MLHFLFTKAEQRPQVRAVVVPVLLDDPGEVERDKFLIVAKQMDISGMGTAVGHEGARAAADSSPKYSVSMRLQS